MKYVIGIDQGATKTHAALSDENGCILAVARTSGAEHHYNGLNCQIGFIDRVCSELLENAGIDKKDVMIVFSGLTGVDWPGEQELMENEIRKLGFCCKIFIVNDCIVALRGGTSENFGAVICAGTGVNCAVISPDGREFIYGYYAESDLQGAVALGRHTLTAVYKSKTGRLGPTCLTEKVRQRFGISDIDTLLRSDVEGRLPEEKVMLLPLDLFEAAYDGDVIAADIIKKYGAGLASLVNARAVLFNMNGIAFDVVVSGSIFKGPGTLLTDVVTSEIHTVCPKANIINARYEPVAGAVILALEKLHGRYENKIRHNIETTSSNFGLLRQFKKT
ncbi:MAG: hypothetical protein HPY74_11355 [Firmicutes bacterium]|nr:hypothetical protein [Bacillota bacterium]